MTLSENNESVSKIYAWGFPINLSLELMIQFISLIIPIFLIFITLKTGNFMALTLVVLLSLYIYPLMILFLGAIATRLLPKPSLGYLTKPEDQLKFQILAALNKFIRRTPARWLLLFPFPAYRFYKIAGAKIDITAFQSSADSIPDPYLVYIGKNTLLGWNCAILGHCSPNAFTTFLGKINIGDNVLIGESVTIWPNVKIGDNSIIQNKSVVFPGTIIPSNQVWGGNPAQKIKDVNSHTVLELKKLPPNQLQEMELFLTELLTNKYQIELINNNTPLLELNLEIEDISYILRQIEKRFNLFIDRTIIDCSALSFNKLIELIEQN